MSTLLLDYLLFLAKALTLGGTVVAVLWLSLRGIAAARRHAGENIELRDLGSQLRETADCLQLQLAPARSRRSLRRQQRRRKAATSDEASRLFVLDFVGDLDATRVKALREEISVLLQIVRSGDRVLLRLDSGGGSAPSYGLAAAQLARLRERGLHLTVAVDHVAASGGYMMACVADRIVAAPFAVLGSIGVVAQLPNFNRWLKGRGIDYELHTAGEHKRNLTVFGENSEAQRAHFRAGLEEVHQLFKSFVAHYRPALDLAQVATGEHWMGTRALELGLIDALRTSDDLLLEAIEQGPVYLLHKPLLRSWRNRLLGSNNTDALAAGLRAEAMRLLRAERP